MTAGLERMVVLDLTAYLAGPYGCAILGDVGADVIKIEPPAGDNARNYPSSLKDESRSFLGSNRNKRSIVIDLKHPDGLAAFYRLVDKADVIVHNFRPSVPDRLGIDYETLRRRRPNLIYCSVTGYGENENGPLRDHPGFDTMLQCFTGIATRQGIWAEAGRPQTQTGSVVDYYSASMVAIAILSALVHRLRTGEGQHVKASLLRSAISLQSSSFVWAESEARDIARGWGQSYTQSYMGIYPAKVGHVYLQATTQTFWRNLCEHLGFPELAEDPRYDTVTKRNHLTADIRPRIADALLQRTALEWEQLLLGKVPCIAVRSMEDMFDHPQVVAEGIVVEHEHPRIGKYRSMGKVVQMGVEGKPTTRAPMFAEHTDEVLSQFGFGDDEIGALHANGAVR